MGYWMTDDRFSDSDKSEQLLISPLVGVPKRGVISVGDVALTGAPVPVASVQTAALIFAQVIFLLVGVSLALSTISSKLASFGVSES